MPRPTDRAQLLSRSQAAFDELMAAVEAVPVEERLKAGACGGWSVKDLLAHLHAWHEMFFSWYDTGMAGGKPALPAPGFSWKDTPALNEKIYQEYKDADYRVVAASLKESHLKIMALAERHSDAELFTKQKYAWTGSTSLGAYFIGSMSSHYEWASGLIKKWRRGPGQAGRPS